MERYGQLKKDEMKAKKTYVYIYISWGGGGEGGNKELVYLTQYQFFLTLVYFWTIKLTFNHRAYLII